MVGRYHYRVAAFEPLRDRMGEEFVLLEDRASVSIALRALLVAGVVRAHRVYQAIKQIAAGEPVNPARPLGIGAIIAIVIGALLLLVGVVIPLLAAFVF